jgi:hypothetical protein
VITTHNIRTMGEPCMDYTRTVIEGIREFVAEPAKKSKDGWEGERTSADGIVPPSAPSMIVMPEATSFPS